MNTRLTLLYQNFHLLHQITGARIALESVRLEIHTEDLHVRKECGDVLLDVLRLGDTDLRWDELGRLSPMREVLCARLISEIDSLTLVLSEGR